MSNVYICGYFLGREKRDFLERALRDMSKDQKRDFFSLHDSKVAENEEKTVDGIWRTNNFALGQSGSKCDNGLFLRISRFNHSCVPLAEFVWNAEKRLQEIRAIRNIPARTEITICYFTSLVAVRYDFWIQQEPKVSWSGMLDILCPRGLY